MTVPTLQMITLDCAEVRPLAEFWSALLEWDVTHQQDEYAMLTGPGVALGIGQVEDYRSPDWPNENGGKQFHFDLGATVPDDQRGETWRVLLDPAGHPFCLTDAANWG